MKIAILSSFYPYRGGMSQFNTSLYEELGKTNDVKAFNFKRQYPSILFPGKTQYVEGKEPAFHFESERVLDTINPFSYASTAKRISEWHPNLLLMRYWMPFFAPSQGYVARHIDKDCKVISIVDNVIPHERRIFDETLTKYFLKGNDAFVVLCNSVGNDLVKIIPDAKYIVSPHPIYSNFGERMERSEALKQLGLSFDKKTLLFFGLIREYKGLDILIEAFSKLDNSYQLIIAGEAYGSFKKYEELIAASPLKDNIHLFNKFIPDEEVAIFFCAADLCVLPYRSATQSGISAIAYHFDLPLVVTSVGGLKETIGDRGTGIVTDKISPEAIKEAIIKYFKEKDLQKKYIENIKREKNRLSWKMFCDNLINLYHQL